MRLARMAIVLSLAAASALAQDYSGSWCGTTSQGKSIYFRVVNNQVTFGHVGFSFIEVGNSCPVGASKSISPAVPIQGGRATFGQSTVPGLFIAWTVIANFSSATEASGSLTAQASPAPFAPCSAGTTATWTATRSATPLSITPSSQSLGSGGGMGRIQVSASDECSWTASEVSSWLTLQTTSGSGSSAANFFAQTNATGGSRTATLNVEDLTATVTQGTTPDVRQLPVVGSTPGSLGSFFKTAVQIHNRTTSTMTGKFIFHPQASSGSDADPSLAYSLAGGQTLYYTDLLPVMGQAGLGSIDVIATAGGFPVAVVRIFNDAGTNGTTGMTEDLVREEEPLSQGMQGVLIAPPDANSARFNIGVRTLGSGASMTVTQRSSDGSVKRTVTKTYGATWFEQTSAAGFVGGEVASSDTLTFRIDSGSAIVYGSATDNKTQDPALQFARPLTAFSSGETRILTVVGSSPGSLGSFFRTAIQIHNPASTTLTGRFIFHPQGGTGTATDPSMTYSLAAGQTIAYADLLPAMGQSGLGSVDIVPTSGAMPVTVARVYNDGGDAGTTGLSLELLTADKALHEGESAVLIVPPDLTKARYNIGIRTLESGATININVKDSSGKSVKTLSKTFAPTFFQQVGASSFIEADPPANGSIFIYVTAGSATLYGATTDNITQDPSVQHASRHF